MTVIELIEKLKTVEDPNTKVFVKGYEGGLDDATFDTKLHNILLNVNSEWYYGKHELTYNNNSDTHKIIGGIIIS
jgi:hypothetical protein